MKTLTIIFATLSFFIFSLPASANCVYRTDGVCDSNEDEKKGFSRSFEKKDVKGVKPDRPRKDNGKHKGVGKGKGKGKNK